MVVDNNQGRFRVWNAATNLESAVITGDGHVLARNIVRGNQARSWSYCDFDGGHCTNAWEIRNGVNVANNLNTRVTALEAGSGGGGGGGKIFNGIHSYNTASLLNSASCGIYTCGSIRKIYYSANQVNANVLCREKGFTRGTWVGIGLPTAGGWAPYWNLVIVTAVTDAVAPSKIPRPGAVCLDGPSCYNSQIYFGTSLSCF